jgi:hypothetical protein
MEFGASRPAEAVSQNDRIAVLHSEAAVGERHGCCAASENVPDVFVAWDCPSRAIDRQDAIKQKGPL